jgi:regulator of sirC expression with transglutaminase-like and TPR domain
MGKSEHCRPEAYELFRASLPALETGEGLLRAAIAISMHQLEGVTTTWVDRELEDLAQEVRARVRSQDPRAVFAHLHEVLFGRGGFVGEMHDYYDPRNSYIPAVLETRRGIPISLTLIYKIVAGRLGLRVHGINAPGHFLAEVRVGADTLLVDTFSAGRVLSREDAFVQMERALGTAVPREDRHLQRATHGQWIERMLGNLGDIFQKRGQEEDFAAMGELKALLGDREA